MSDVTTVSNLLEYNWGYVIIGMVLFAVGVKAIITLIDFFIDKFGITTKKKIKEQEEKALLSATADGLAETTATIEEMEAQRQLDYEENKENSKMILTTLKELQGTVGDIDNRSKANTEGIVEILRETIDQKYDYYVNTLHGIPADEVETFRNLSDVYLSNGGNHGRETKCRYVLEELTVIPTNKGFIYERVN